MSENKKISERAQKVLDLLQSLKDLTLNPSPKLGEGLQIWIRQTTLAEHFGCSRTTIGRMLKELKEAGLVTELSQKYLNRYKTYSLRHCERSEAIQKSWMATSPSAPRHDDSALMPHPESSSLRAERSSPSSCISTSPSAPRHDDNVLPMSLADVRLDEPAQIVRDKNEIEALLAKHGAEWQRRHPYFGTGDKPTLRRWVFNMGLYGKPFRLREGKNLEEWIESMFITTEKWALEYAMSIVARQKREQEQEQEQR